MSEQLTLFCQQYPYPLDGGSVYTLDFIETFLQTVLPVSEEEAASSLPITRANPSSPSSSSPFPWPLVDMAEYEFGSFGIENEVDMK
jgi:hypothetical protein